MLRIKNKKSQVRLVSTVIVSALLVIGALAYWQRNTIGGWFSQPEKNVSTDNNSPDSKASNDSTPNPSNVDSSGHEKEKNIEPPYEGKDPNESHGLTGVITYTGVVDGKLMIRTTINQTLGSGACRLTLSSGSKTVTRDSGIVPNPSSSTCEGFDIPTTELGSGKWNITITITSDNRSGELKGNVTM